MSVRVPIVVYIEKEPTNEVQDDAWIPHRSEVATEVAGRLVGWDLDTGWRVAEVRPGQP